MGHKIDGFFPTPVELVRAMLRYADIQPGVKVLEPSAGKGNIADLVRELHPDAHLDVIECNYTLRGILTYERHNLIGVDCLEIQNPIYSVIVMNPPFEKLADIGHLRYCFDHYVKPGGRLVSIMGETPFFRTDKKAMQFREWLADVQTAEMRIPSGAFLESGTEVATRMIVADKPFTSDLSPDTPADEGKPQPETVTAEDMISLAVDLGLLPAAQEGDDPLEQFLDEDGEFLPLYSDDIEAELGDMSETTQAAPPSVPDEPSSTPSPYQERGLQKALDGFGTHDKLLKLRQVKFF